MIIIIIVIIGEYSVSLWSFVMTRLTEEMTVITTDRT